MVVRGSEIDREITIWRVDAMMSGDARGSLSALGSEGSFFHFCSLDVEYGARTV